LSHPGSQEELAHNPHVDEFFNRLQSDMRRPFPSQEAVSDAMQTMQRLAAESAVVGHSGKPGGHSVGQVSCEACGHPNRAGSQFCEMCGVPVPPGAQVRHPAPSRASDFSEPEALPPGQHHYHHHFHHHYFAPGQDPGAGPVSRPIANDPTTAKLRTPGGGAPMSRIETAVRKVTLDWALACNSRQLDDLVSTYAADAIVLRPNHPPVRGTAAIREFFFAALDAGFGEVELDPLRVDIVGDVAYEVGRCKMLVPFVVGKRREERGKYLTVLARQPNGEWRIVSDCWSSDLSLSAQPEPEHPKPVSTAAPTQKPAPPRKPL
jgi:ketosteroid isomerase-like protein